MPNIVYAEGLKRMLRKKPVANHVWPMRLDNLKFSELLLDGQCFFILMK